MAPENRIGFAGPAFAQGLVTAMDAGPTGFTVSVLEPLILPALALIVVVPLARATATPRLPASLLMVATAVVDEIHATEANFCVLPSLKKPVAMNCWLVVAAIDGLIGATVIDTRPCGTRVSGLYRSALTRIFVF